jgi:hypothetical protein
MPPLAMLVCQYWMASHADDLTLWSWKKRNCWRGLPGSPGWDLLHMISWSMLFSGIKKDSAKRRPKMHARTHSPGCNFNDIIIEIYPRSQSCHWQPG